MSLADRAVWCVACGAPPTVTITVERNGVMAHYGACDAHIEAVGRRVRAEALRLPDVGPTPVRGTTGQIRADAGTLAAGADEYADAVKYLAEHVPVPIIEGYLAEGGE